jgi:hypothetical protein
MNAMDLGFNIQVELTEPTLMNSDGFSSELESTIMINVSDNLGIASISRNVTKEVMITITNVEDPIYPLNTLGFVSRSFRLYPYPYHAIKIASGTGFGSCTGNITVDRNDPGKASKILLTDDASGVSGFAGVVGEGSGVPAVSCHLISTGVGTVARAMNITSWSGFWTIDIDNESGGLWSVPVRDAYTGKLYSRFETDGGPDALKRLEGDYSSGQNGIESFVDIQELQDKGVTVKPNQVSIDYLYFSNDTIIGQGVRLMSANFRIDSANAVRYNLTELM